MAEIKFEQALNKLEKIVGDMESGELSLEDSLKKYEEGMKLSRLCSKKLKEAEKKIEVLIKNNEGNLITEPFDSEKIQEKEFSESPLKSKQKPTNIKEDDDEDLLF